MTIVKSPYELTKEQYDWLTGPDRPKVNMEKLKELANIHVHSSESTMTIVPAEIKVPTVGVQLKKLHDDAVIPTYGTDGAAGFDFYAIGDYVVDPGKTVVVKTGLAMAIPKGYYLAVVPRSGVSVKTGIRVANAPGTVDCDYRGEIGIIVTNTSNDTFTIDNGYRIAQGIILPYFQADFTIVDELDETARGAGGYGSTGVK